MKKLVSIIIVNWNGKNFLPKCLSSLFTQDYKNFELIFVDNASIDGSVDYVHKNYSKAKVIVNKKNLGYAEGNNIGYKKAKGDYVLFLNNDTKVTKNFLTELVSVLESDSEIGGAQSKLLLMDSPSKLDCVGAYLTLTGFLYYYGIFKRNSSLYNSQIYLYTAKGASMIFKRNVLEKIKLKGRLLDERYFAYFEETDMCHRVWLAGYKIVFAPNSIIYHKMGGTSMKLNNTFVQYHSFKNRINCYIKNLGIWQLIKILPIHLLVCEIYALSLLRYKPSLALSIQKSIMWNVLNLKETLKLRKIVQRKIRKQKDKEIFKFIYKHPRVTYYYHINNLDKFKDSDFLYKYEI